MVADGIVRGYVIGGAMGPLFYTDPFETHDLHIFVAFPEESGRPVTLAPVHDYLKESRQRARPRREAEESRPLAPGAR
jgi:hypothetical protein